MLKDKELKKIYSNCLNNEDKIKEEFNYVLINSLYSLRTFGVRLFFKINPLKIYIHKEDAEPFKTYFPSFMEGAISKFIVPIDKKTWNRIAK